MLAAGCRSVQRHVQPEHHQACVELFRFADTGQQEVPEGRARQGELGGRAAGGTLVTDKYAPAGTCTVLSVPPPLGPQLLSTLLGHISWLRVTWMIPALLNPPSACPALPMRDQVSKCHMPTSVSHGSDRAEGLIPDIVWEKYLLKLGSTETVHGPCPTPPPPPLIFTPARPCAHKLCICQAPPHTHTHTMLHEYSVVPGPVAVGRPGLGV